MRDFGCGVGVSISIAIAVSIAVALIAGDAAAHARLARSTPAEGEVLEAAPAEVVLVFEGGVERRFARFVLERAGGSARRLEGPPGGGVTTELAIPLGALDPGDYRLQWSVVSRDGHRIRGALRFSIRIR
ncbi:MAG: copper resistance CopC family protein [Kofleriaceae bacterium]